MIALNCLNKQLKLFLLVFVFVLTAGVTVGLVYLMNTTHFTPKEALERYNGSEQSTDDIEIPDQYPKSFEEMLVTTHSHVIMLSIIFGIVGILFNFNSIVKGRLKLFLMIEPLLSIILSFGSIWLFRFVHPDFVYVAAVSGTLMYLVFYINIMVISVDLIRD